MKKIDDGVFGKRKCRIVSCTASTEAFTELVLVTIIYEEPASEVNLFWKLDCDLVVEDPVWKIWVGSGFRL